MFRKKRGQKKNTVIVLVFTNSKLPLSVTCTKTRLVALC